MEFFHSPKFSSHVDDLMEQYHVPGLAIALVQNDRIASAGFGKASLEPSSYCTADTLFDIASLAKSLTAASVALLVDDNKNHPEVQYTATMSSLLPDDFVMKDAGYTEGVTVEDVLSHRTGMPAHINSALGPKAAQPDNARSITRNLRNLPTAAPIRSKFLYCNMMFTVATHLIEVKCQQPFAEFLQDRIFRPLLMQSTSLQLESIHTKGLTNQVAIGYVWDQKRRAYDSFQMRDCPESQGAGSVFTNVNDFVKWVKALMNREYPINEKVYQGLIQMRTITNPNARRLKKYTSPAIYAAGLEVYYYRGHMVIGHNGMTTGFTGRFFFLPDFKFGGVILGNSEGGTSVATILIRELINEVLEASEVGCLSRGQSKDVLMDDSNAAIHDQDDDKRNVKRPKDQGKEERRERVKAREKGKEEGKGNKIGRGKTRQTSPTYVENPASLQKRPLTAYTGKYYHPGYHTLMIQIKDGSLFIDATDRSMGFTLTFEHVCAQTKYIAHLSDFLEGGDDMLEAEFVFENDKVVRMGLRLETALVGLIWFERVN